jgi:tRNA nucleotidyltransferase (CCA-adding enzyme)
LAGSDVESEQSPSLAAAQKVMRQLMASDFQAYFVGGYVRDQLLGRQPKDIDIATNAHPEQVEALFEHTIPTGRQHGTMTVVIDGVPIEVTTFRLDKDYQDFRRPSEVAFVSSIEEDLSRRDFTFNAMALDIQGQLHDPFGGADDLQRQVVRAVGDPKQRFQEDALRILRAIRFAAQLQFELEEQTAKAIDQQKESCRHLAIERVVAEWEKIWAAPQPARGVKLASSLQLFAVLPPFCNWTWNEEKLASHSVLFIPGLKDHLYWTFLLCLAETPLSDVSTRVHQLRLRRRDGQVIEQLFAIANQLNEVKTKGQWQQFLLHHGLTMIEESLYLHAFQTGKSVQQTQIEKVRSLWTAMPVTKLSDLKVNGHDLLACLSRPGGPWVQQILRYLLYQVATKQIANEKEILIKEGIRFATGNADQSVAITFSPSRTVSLRRRDRSADGSQSDDDLEMH